MVLHKLWHKCQQIDDISQFVWAHFRFMVNFKVWDWNKEKMMKGKPIIFTPPSSIFYCSKKGNIITTKSRTPRIIFILSCFVSSCYCLLFAFEMLCALRKLKLFKAVIDVDQIHQNVNWLLVVGFHKIHSLCLSYSFFWPPFFFISPFNADSLLNFILRYNLVDMRL